MIAWNDVGTASSYLVRRQGSSCKVVGMGRNRTGSGCPWHCPIPFVSGSDTLGTGLASVAGAEPGCGHFRGHPPPPPPAALCCLLHPLVK